MRSLQNTTKKTRTKAKRKLKEEEDLNDKLTTSHKSVEHKGSQRKWLRNVEKKCRAPRLSKNKNEKEEVSSHKGGVALYTS